MMTTSERRDAVAESIYRREESMVADNVLSWPLVCERYPGDADRYRDIADAAISAALPERAALDKAIDEVIRLAVDNETVRCTRSPWAVDFDPEWTETNTARAALLALVYGEDAND